MREGTKVEEKKIALEKNRRLEAPAWWRDKTYPGGD